jgi:voltage-gated potassium channel
VAVKIMSERAGLFFNKLGLGMVDIDENQYAQIGNSIAFVLFISVALVLLWQWQFDVTHTSVDVVRQLLVDWLVWGIFIFNFVFLILLVSDKKRFLRHNWLILFTIIVGSFLLFWHDSILADVVLARLIMAIIILLPAIPFLINFFVDGRLWTTVMAAGVVILIFGILVAGVDPAINGVGNGVWWALATVSTVGYGDVVPVTAVGRGIGAMLVIIGLGVFVVITANFLRLILAKEAEALSGDRDIDMTKVQQQLNTFHQNQKTILQQLEDIQSQLKLSQSKSESDEG